MGLAVGQIMSVLGGFSSRQRREIMAAVGGTMNLRLQSNFAPSGPVAVQKQVSAPKGQKTRQQQRPKDPAVASLRRRIDAVNRQISQRSKDLGHQLEDTDPLLEDRNQLFRGLKEAQGKAGPAVAPKERPQGQNA